MTANELLQFLLHAADPKLASLKAALATSAPAFLQVTTGDGTPLFRIYTIKSEIAKDKGACIEGYEDLLPNLQGAQNRQVSILHINTKSKVFLVFTDAETNNVLGVLSADRKP